MSASPLRLAQTPRAVRRVGWCVLFAMLGGILLLLLAPWQQSLDGTGRVIAFNPVEREQTVQAPVDGRVAAWQVVEGQYVRGPRAGEPGDVLVQLLDPDSEFAVRLEQRKQAIARGRDRVRERAAKLGEQVQQIQGGLPQQRLSLTNRIEEARARQRRAEQEVVQMRATEEQAKFVFENDETNFRKGLINGVDFATAKQRYLDAQARVRAAGEGVQAVAATIEMLGADLRFLEFAVQGNVLSALGNQAQAEAEVARAEEQVQVIDTAIARQQQQVVRAPCSGWVFRLLAASPNGGTVVKQGSPLCVLVPDLPDAERVVELLLDGNDAPLVTLFQEELKRGGAADASVYVRLQFEGWPAVQFVGYPSAAVGTFGGRVRLVDRATTGDGKFRLLVEPDPREQADPATRWPAGQFLRQGTRTNGWVLLKTVPLGYELWRRLNGFPPVVAAQEPPAGKGTKE